MLRDLGKKLWQFGLLLALASPLWATTVSTTYSRVEELTGWLTCGSCGDNGGDGALANYYMTRGITTPSMDGSSSKFSISATKPYANGYWYFNHSAPDHALTYLSYEFYVYIPSGYQNAPQAIEFECQHRVNGWVYNFAWQADYASNTWRFFNYSTKSWVYSGLSLKRFTAGAWHHVIATFHTSSTSHTVYHDTLTIDGVQHTVNKSNSATYTGNYYNRFTNAFQLDINGVDTAYHLYVDGMKINLQYPD
jgi:hypothetical protein